MRSVLAISGLLATLAVVFLPSILLAEEAAPSTADLNKRAAEIIERMAIRDAQTVWNLVPSLEELGEGAADGIEAGLEHDNPAVRLACAKALFELDLGDPEPVAAIIEKGQEPLASMAASVLGEYGEDEEAEILGDAMEGAGQMSVRIACAAALARIEPRHRRARSFLSELLASEDPSLSEEAALLLAELDEATLALGVLERMADEPSVRGRLARSLIRRKILKEAVDQQAAPEGDPVEEVSAIIRENYVRKTVDRRGKTVTIDDEFLRDSAAAGIIHSLDPFCGYMTDDEFREDRRRAQGQYAGIGAYVVMREVLGSGKSPKPGESPELVITVDRPNYDPPAPAYNAGIRSGDQVVAFFDEEKGDWTSIIGWKLERCVEHLKGKVGTTVRVKVRRHGLKDLKEIAITRQMITVNAALGKMLPGNIGYILLRRFDNKSATDFENALSVLEKQGMSALVLDLRGNPGGTMREVVSIIDKFVDPNLLITYTRGQVDDWNQSYYARKKPHPHTPLSVLIRNDSASGSEMLSGALKAHKRGVIVGERSYGKGSGQTLMPLRTTKGKRWLRLTIFKYYLPDRTSIHEKGVEPDVIQKSERVEPWQYDWQTHLYRSEIIEDYAAKHWAADHDLMTTLAVYDGKRTDRYPGFDDLFRNAVDILYRQRKEHTLDKTFPDFDGFFAQYDTPEARDYIRLLVRSALRNRVQDEQGAPFIQDFQEDIQLQRAIFEVLKKMGKRPADIPKFSLFDGLFSKPSGD